MEENLENDISYLLGTYVGMGRTIEKELDRLIKKQTESAIEDWLEEFSENPGKALRHCQDVILTEQIALKRIDKTALIDESAAILKKIKIEALDYITLDIPHFLHGYHTIQEEHGFS